MAGATDSAMENALPVDLTGEAEAASETAASAAGAQESPMGVASDPGTLVDGSGALAAAEVATDLGVKNCSTREQHGFDVAEKFFRDLVSEAKKEACTVPDILVARYAETSEALKATKVRMLKVFPWCGRDDGVGYVSMLSAPKSLRMTGRVHVCMLSFHPDSYHAKGICYHDVEDVFVLMRQSGCGVTLDVTPAGAGGDLGLFGWAYDGSIANSVHGMALTVLALALMEEVERVQVASTVTQEDAVQATVSKTIMSALTNVRAKYSGHVGHSCYSLLFVSALS
jgi:hypothetical protein